MSDNGPSATVAAYHRIGRWWALYGIQVLVHRYPGLKRQQYSHRPRLLVIPDRSSSIITTHASGSSSMIFNQTRFQKSSMRLDQNTLPSGNLSQSQRQAPSTAEVEMIDAIIIPADEPFSSINPEIFLFNPADLYVILFNMETADQVFELPSCIVQGKLVQRSRTTGSCLSLILDEGWGLSTDLVVLGATASATARTALRSFEICSKKHIRYIGNKESTKSIYDAKIPPCKFI